MWCRQCIHGLFPSKSEALHNRSVRRELLGMTYRVLTDLLNITYNRDTIIVIDDDPEYVYEPGEMRPRKRLQVRASVIGSFTDANNDTGGQ